MSNNKQYPTFLWIITGVILIVLIGYALKVGLIPTKIVFPGGSVELKEKPKDEVVTFSVSYDLPSDVLYTGLKESVALQAQTVIYLDGKLAATLFVDRNKRSATANIKVDRPGSYSYILEQEEVYPAYTEIPYSYKRQRRGTGKIDVTKGVAFIVTMAVDLNARSAKVILSKILSDEEEAQRTKKFLKNLK